MIYRMVLNILKLKHLGLLTLVLFLASCNDDENPDGGNDNFDRQAMLVNLADNVIVPSYDSLNSATTSLKTKVEQLQGSVSAENIELAKSQWKKTLSAWQYAGVYNFGPASDRGLVALFNPYPVSETRIEENIASGNYNLESAVNINAVGLQAIDYLLFGIETESENLAEFFSNNPNYLLYLNDNVALLDSKIQSTLEEWNQSYRSTFVNATGTDIGSSLGQLVNSSIEYLEIYIRDAKVGIPAGARSSSGFPLPAQVEAFYNGSISNEMLDKGLEGWKNMFLGNSLDGNEGLGLDDYLIFLGTTFDGNPLHEEILNRLSLAQEKTLALNNDMKLAVVEEQDVCLEIFEELQRSIVLLKVDMTSAMGIQITYVDNDGD